MLSFSLLRRVFAELFARLSWLFQLLLLPSGRSFLAAAALGLLLGTIGVVLLHESQILLNTLHFLDKASLLLQLLLRLQELLLLSRQLLTQLLVLRGELQRRQEVGVILLVLCLFLARAVGVDFVSVVDVILLITCPDRTSSLLVFVA